LKQAQYGASRSTTYFKDAIVYLQVQGIQQGMGRSLPTRVNIARPTPCQVYQVFKVHSGKSS
jgi:hypothetical protein